MMSCSVLLYPKNQKKNINMSKESKCFDLNSKQKKHYEKWKKLIKNLSRDKPKEKESKNKKKEKKTFEDYFSVSTITKYYVNNLDYEAILRT
jgi:D-hexose-6-phosphate mutarotase